MTEPILETPWMHLEKTPAGDLHTKFCEMALMAHATGRCVLCTVEQPIDVVWARYALEIESIGDVEYNVCPKCEPTVDEILKAWGAE